jgi:putative acetyltransferase
VNIRPEREDDRDVTYRIERDAFERDLEADIARAVADDEGSFALVAEDAGEIVGHVQMSRAWAGERPILALGPIGVVAGRRREGIGSALVRAALDEAERRGEPAVMLLGEPAFYGRFGFRRGADLGLPKPYGDDEDVPPEDDPFLVRPLGDPPPTLAGPARWHPAFDEAG